MDSNKLWLMNNWLNVKSACCALRIWLHCKLYIITVVSDNYLMPYKWHRLFYYCKSTLFCGMHFCLQCDSYSAYYASIMLDAFRHLLRSKLCRHNRLVPNEHESSATSFCLLVCKMCGKGAFSQIQPQIFV